MPPPTVFFRYLSEFLSVGKVLAHFWTFGAGHDFCFWIHEKIFIFKKVRAQNFLLHFFHNSILGKYFLSKKNPKMSDFQKVENFRNFRKFSDFEKKSTSKKIFFRKNIFLESMHLKVFEKNVFSEKWLFRKMSFPLPHHPQTPYHPSGCFIGTIILTIFFLA